MLRRWPTSHVCWDSNTIISYADDCNETNYYFPCKDGQLCYHVDQICDGIAQCQDRQDEMGCKLYTELQSQRQYQWDKCSLSLRAIAQRWAKTRSPNIAYLQILPLTRDPGQFTHYNAEIFLHKQWRPKGLFQFEIITNALVNSFSFIWIPMLWVYGHLSYFYTLSARIVF